MRATQQAAIYEPKAHKLQIAQGQSGPLCCSQPFKNPPLAFWIILQLQSYCHWWIDIFSTNILQKYDAWFWYQLLLLTDYMMISMPIRWYLGFLDVFCMLYYAISVHNHGVIWCMNLDIVLGIVGNSIINSNIIMMLLPYGAMI